MTRVAPDVVPATGNAWPRCGAGAAGAGAGGCADACVVDVTGREPEALRGGAVEDRPDAPAVVVGADAEAVDLAAVVDRAGDADEAGPLDPPASLPAVVGTEAAGEEEEGDAAVGVMTGLSATPLVVPALLSCRTRAAQPATATMEAPVATARPNPMVPV